MAEYSACIPIAVKNKMLANRSQGVKIRPQKHRSRPTGAAS